MTLIAVTVAIALAVPLLALVVDRERGSLVHELQVEALTTASVLARQPYAMWQQTVDQSPSREGERVVVVSQLMSLVADSDHSGLERAFNRPEIRKALHGIMASDVRYSHTLAGDLRYVAAPVVKDDVVVAAVRYSLPETLVDQAVRRTVYVLAWFVLAVAVVAAGIAWFLASSIAAPVRSLAEIARQLPEDLRLRVREDLGPDEVRSVAVALNDTARRLFELVKRSERVAADASHHLRTPLTGIRLRLEAIADTSADAHVAEQAEHAIGEVDRLNRRIDQVLALARSDAAGADRVRERASELVLDSVRAFTPIADERQLRIDSEVQADVAVSVIPGSMARILDELLSNALHYARTRIRVRMAISDEDVMLQVEDDGPGVPEDELEAIFGRFARGTQAAPGGSGLGLALVRETAVACEGGAFADRGSLGGLRISVRLPRG